MLKVHVKNLETVTILRLQGQIVSGETETLRNTVSSLFQRSAVILDLARVTTIDAHGLGVMLELREQAQTEGIRFELINLSKQVGRVFKLTRLDSVFLISSKVELFPSVSRRARAPVAAVRSCA